MMLFDVCLQQSVLRERPSTRNRRQMLALELDIYIVMYSLLMTLK
jgi:hypothetical protein